MTLSFKQRCSADAVHSGGLSEADELEIEGMDTATAMLRTLDLQDLQRLRGKRTICSYLSFHDDVKGITLPQNVLQQGTTVWILMELPILQELDSQLLHPMSDAGWWEVLF